MAIRPVLRFVGTGKPATANVNPRVERDASRKGVMMSGIDTNGEFKQIVKQDRQNSPQELANSAVQVPRKAGVNFLA